MAIKLKEVQQGLLEEILESPKQVTADKISRLKKIKLPKLKLT